jgi:ketosteroid isomerase-like protein
MMEFQATLELHGKTATGISVPPEVVTALGAGKRPPARVTINGYTYRTTVAAYGEVLHAAQGARPPGGDGESPGDPRAPHRRHPRRTDQGVFVTHITDETRRVVLQFWTSMQANDWTGAAALFADGYVLDWPQSGERIRGAANFVAINASYPAAGRWRFTIERLVVEGEVAVTDVVVSDSAVTARALTFTKVRDGRIASQIEYWPDPFEAPTWRAAWVEREPVTGEL